MLGRGGGGGVQYPTKMSHQCEVGIQKLARAFNILLRTGFRSVEEFLAIVRHVIFQIFIQHLLIFHLL